MLTEEKYPEKGNADLITIVLLVMAVATVIFFLINY
jgi:hypothetical protein